MASDQLRVLLIGNGGREHTLAWKLSQSPRVECIHVVPGNGGTAAVPKCTNIPTLSQEDFPALVNHAKQQKINLCIPGPEAPLVAGIVDHFAQQAPEIHRFGPSERAAAMEGSKTFSKDFMQRHSIPTARYENFTDYDSALAHLDSISYKVVIKADGLAAGKGVIIPSSAEEAKAALKEIMLDREFGAAGSAVVIEEFLEGDEISILSLSDGNEILSLPPAQDHKRIGNGDTGPNTGGMGTYAPTPLVSAATLREIDEKVLKPTIRGMKDERMPFCGCLFTGFMLTRDGPRVLEYNVRFGDPESQSVLPLLKSDLAELMMACCRGTLGKQTLEVDTGSACTVVVAAKGYPGKYPKGTVMKVGEPVEADGVYLFHAGTSRGDDGTVKTSGGRVIAVTAKAGSLREAVDKAYQNIGLVEFEGMQYRKDIAQRALR